MAVGIWPCLSVDVYCLRQAWDKLEQKDKGMSGPLSLSHSEILRSASRTYLQRNIPQPARRRRRAAWPIVCRVFTWWIPSFLLRIFGMADRESRKAWREKFSLCCIIFILSAIQAFFTCGISTFICTGSNQYVYENLHKSELFRDRPYCIVNGEICYLNKAIKSAGGEVKGADLSGCFQRGVDACRRRFGRDVVSPGKIKLSEDDIRRLGTIHYSWSDVKRLNLIVINGEVFNPSLNSHPFYKDFISKTGGQDGTSESKNLSKSELECFKESFYAGRISTKSYGCLFADVFLYLNSAVIFGLVFTRFFLAIFYVWYMRRISRGFKRACETPAICFVTCYSEGREGIRRTLDSLSEQTHKDKLLFIISDGVIKGSENDKATPDILLEMMEVDETQPVIAVDYVALASGRNRHNRAMVYAGWYNTATSRTSTILVVKCGNESEVARCGNRGKRDSQVILMSFFYKLLHDDRFSPLDYDIYKKIRHITGRNPISFELVMMVDADTVVSRDALSQYANMFKRDPKIIGMCGETKIMNRCETWVTMIQVFEYHISHYLTKSFESVFGGVTCLPGCFCVYRLYSVISADGKRTVMPILANALVLNAYSVTEVDTLHQKNLLLLGEDRFLTTMMLKTFHKHKLVFLPVATCKTFVPSTLGVLVSQRRRWINSTVHNLFELSGVNKLCGAFCCSMQFVVVVELFGTLVLPISIIFTGVLIVAAIMGRPAWIPLIMLAALLVLPAVLILIATFSLSQIFWIFMYILSLPIWNLFLPSYSFWHFDDFSWGRTRRVEGGEGHSDASDGEYDPSRVVFRHLVDLRSDGLSLSRPLNGDEAQSSSRIPGADQSHPRANLKFSMKLIVVSNRLPVTPVRADGRYECSRSAGGLVTGLECVKKEMDFVWVGSVDGGSVPPCDRDHVKEELNSLGVCPVFIEPSLYDSSYNGFCNAALWPSFHGLAAVSFGSRDSFSAYSSFNALFLDAISEILDEGDVLWIHDYHLMLLPAMVRARYGDAVKIAFFLHTPFPAPAVAMQLAELPAIVEGVLGSDAVAFHSPEYAINFAETCKVLSVGRASPAAVQLGERSVRLAAIPIGIAADVLRERLKKPSVRSRVGEIRESFGGRKIVLGVDRLDYTKGIPHRISAFSRISSARKDCVFVQVGVPSRTGVLEYKRVAAETKAAVSDANGKCGVDECRVFFINSPVDLDELCALYAASDVCVVTSLKDGMNLVALEYVACQDENVGRVVLSKFAGAATTIPAAVIVNPWDIDELCSAINTCIEMKEGEARERHRINRRGVDMFNATEWARENLALVNAVSTENV